MAAAMSHEIVDSALSEASRMAAASASALPANMVAEMTWNVVSVISRSMAWIDPAGRLRHRCTCSSAAALMAGTRPARSAGRNSGAAVRRCQRQLAPCDVRMPSPSVCSNTCFSSGVLGNCSEPAEKHLLDERRIRHPRDDVAPVVMNDDAVLVDGTRQTGERVADEAQQELAQRQGPRRRLHRRWVQRLPCPLGCQHVRPYERLPPTVHTRTRRRDRLR